MNSYDRYDGYPQRRAHGGPPRYDHRHPSPPPSRPVPPRVQPHVPPYEPAYAPTYPQGGGEYTLWEADSQSLTTLASGGRAVTGRYRLTNLRLYATQGVTTSRTEQYELAWLFDIDIQQTFLQRARGVGDVIVHVRRGWGQETVVLHSVPEPERVRDLLNQVAAQARQPRRHW